MRVDWILTKVGKFHFSWATWSDFNCRHMRSFYDFSSNDSLKYRTTKFHSRLSLNYYNKLSIPSSSVAYTKKLMDHLRKKISNSSRSSLTGNKRSRTRLEKVRHQRRRNRKTEDFCPLIHFIECYSSSIEMSTMIVGEQTSWKFCVLRCDLRCWK